MEEVFDQVEKIDLSERVLMTRSLLKESIEAMDEDFRKDKNKDKLLSKFDQEQSYLFTDVVMYMLEKDGVVVAVIISGNVAKKLLMKCINVNMDFEHFQLTQDRYILVNICVSINFQGVAQFS